MSSTVTDADATVDAVDPVPQTRSAAARTALLAAVPAVVMLAVGLTGIAARQLWRDELSTLIISGYPLGELRNYVRVTDMVNAPYYLLMHFWTGVFGVSEIALRLPALLGFAATASLTALIGRRLFGPIVGLVAGIVVALMPYVVRYAEEARSFGLTAAAATLAFLLLLRAIERPTWWRWIAYAAAVVAAGAFHLVALLVLPAHAVYVAVTWARSRDRRLVIWLGAVAVAVVALSPLLIVGRAQSDQVNWIPATTLDRTVEALTRFTGSHKVTAVLLGLVLLGVWPLGRRTATLLTWAVGPFVALLLASPFVDLLLDRYMLFTLPAFALLAAAAVERYAGTVVAGGRAGWHRWAAPVLVVALVLALGVETIAANRRVDATPEPDLRAAARLIAAGYQPGDSIGYQGRTPELWAWAVRYYLPAGVDAPTLFLAPGPSVRYTAACAGGPACPAVSRVWLVNTNSPVDPMAGVGATLRADLERWYATGPAQRVHGATVTVLARAGT
jgi:mannosyltransferase